jgi:hypothetical protein
MPAQNYDRKKLLTDLRQAEENRSPSGVQGFALSVYIERPVVPALAFAAGLANACTTISLAA